MTEKDIARLQREAGCANPFWVVSAHRHAEKCARERAEKLSSPEFRESVARDRLGVLRREAKARHMEEMVSRLEAGEVEFQFKEQDIDGDH